MVSGDYYPIYISLALIFILGGIIPLIVNSFVDVDIPRNDSTIEPIVTFLTDGVNVTVEIPFLPDFNFDFDPLFFFPDSIQDFIDQQLIAITYIPDYISIPIGIFIILGILWSIVALLLP